jgi:hypothetical protein
MQRNVERINDMSSGEYVDVLLGIDNPVIINQDGFKPLTDSLQTRRLASSARDNLPSDTRQFTRAFKTEVTNSAPEDLQAAGLSDMQASIRTATLSLFANDRVKNTLALASGQLSRGDASQVSRPNMSAGVKIDHIAPRQRRDVAD